ncbi:MAG: type II toxin-antitoxin system VapB family antitoxin [Azospirillaceae bacterium]|nr:type II toxin-antitoxin system VapB family antitoxin [Azospirillaceae bacterium]
METAKIFMNGRSQAVRLPKGFRFDATEVRIRRHGNSVILEPIPNDWAWLDHVVGAVDEDFARAVTEQPPAPDLPELDFFG